MENLISWVPELGRIGIDPCSIRVSSVAQNRLVKVIPAQALCQRPFARAATGSRGDSVGRVTNPRLTGQACAATSRPATETTRAKRRDRGIAG
jgi:hypothetical protein